MSLFSSCLLWRAPSRLRGPMAGWPATFETLHPSRSRFPARFADCDEIQRSCPAATKLACAATGACWPLGSGEREFLGDGLDPSGELKSRGDGLDPSAPCAEPLLLLQHCVTILGRTFVAPLSHHAKVCLLQCSPTSRPVCVETEVAAA